MNSAVGEARGLPMPLRGSYREFVPLTLQRSIYREIDRNQSIMHKPAHERFRILKVRVCPRRAIQPEGLTRRFRQNHISSIKEISCGQAGMKVPGLKRMPSHSPSAEHSRVAAFVSRTPTVRVVLPLCASRPSPHGSRQSKGICQRAHYDSAKSIQ